MTSIVTMTTAHIDALLPYEREMFGPEAWTRRGYRDELADTKHRTYVAIEDADGTLLGWGGVRVLGPEAEILTVGVVPTARRRGLGRDLVRALVHAARDQGAAETYLEVRTDNAAAIALYESEGFVRLGVRRGYYDAGRADALTMKLDVP